MLLADAVVASSRSVARLLRLEASTTLMPIQRVVTRKCRVGTSIRQRNRLYWFIAIVFAAKRGLGR
jgi:hypothetical protein